MKIISNLRKIISNLVKIILLIILGVFQGGILGRDFAFALSERNLRWALTQGAATIVALPWAVGF